MGSPASTPKKVTGLHTKLDKLQEVQTSSLLESFKSKNLSEAAYQKICSELLASKEAQRISEILFNKQEINWKNSIEQLNLAAEKNEANIAKLLEGKDKSLQDSNSDRKVERDQFMSLIGRMALVQERVVNHDVEKKILSVDAYTAHEKETFKQFRDLLPEIADKTPKTQRNSVAVVGKTSSGKSSLLNVLFNVNCPVGQMETTEGVQKIPNNSEFEVFDIYGINDEQTYLNIEMLSKLASVRRVILVYSNSITDVQRLMEILDGLKLSTILVRNKMDRITQDERNNIRNKESLIAKQYNPIHSLHLQTARDLQSRFADEREKNKWPKEMYADVLQFDTADDFEQKNLNNALNIKERPHYCDEPHVKIEEEKDLN